MEEKQLTPSPGELHSEVLEAWQITMPIAAFEFQVSGGDGKALGG